MGSTDAEGVGGGDRTAPARPDADVESERGRLVGMAFRMLGTVAEAEDAVQDAFERWYRQDPTARAAIASPAAWLTRVTSRICLDVLGSARMRRERYVGPWLPEPVPWSARAIEDPADLAARADSVSSAMLLVMERMTPAERVAFVLHDVFGYSFDEIGRILDRNPGAARQLASSARRRVREERRTTVDPAEHARVVQAFLEAASGGDLVGLTALLDPNVVLTSDGGGLARAARNRILGTDRVARFLLGVLQRQPRARLAPGFTADGAAVLFVTDGRVTGVVDLVVGESGSVTDIRVQWNPEKLTRWSTPNGWVLGTT